MGEPAERLEIAPRGAPRDAWAAVEGAKAPGPAKTKLVDREIDVRIEWTDPDTGETRACKARSRVMGADEKGRFALACADMAGHRPWESIPGGLQARIGAQVRCALQLRSSPDWLRAALGEDDDLLFDLEGVLVAHERKFRGADRAADGGGAPSHRLAAPALDAAGTVAPAGE